MIKRFDIVKLKTTRNIEWLSGPAGRPANPHGNWSVVAGVGSTDKLLIASNETVAQVPEADVVKVADFGIDHALDSIKKIRNFSDILKHPLLEEKDHGEEKSGEIGYRGIDSK